MFAVNRYVQSVYLRSVYVPLDSYDSLWNSVLMLLKGNPAAPSGRTTPLVTTDASSTFTPTFSTNSLAIRPDYPSTYPTSDAVNSIVPSTSLPLRWSATSPQMTSIDWTNSAGFTIEFWAKTSVGTNFDCGPSLLVMGVDTLNRPTLTFSPGSWSGSISSKATGTGYITTSITGSTPLSTGWHHFAMTTTAGTQLNNPFQLTFFVDGAIVLQTNVTIPSTTTDALGNTVAVSLTSISAGSSFFFNHSTPTIPITGIRIIGNYCASTTAFTRPYTKVTATTLGWNNSSAAISGSTGAYVTHFVGSYNPFYDAKYNFAVIQAAPLASSGAFVGSLGLSHNGTANIGSSIAPISSSYTIGSSDFTLEFFIYRTVSSTDIVMASPSGTGFFSLSVTTTNLIALRINSTTTRITAPCGINAWYAVQVIRTGTTWSMTTALLGAGSAVTGTPATFTATSNIDGTGSWIIGGDSASVTAANAFNGILDYIRITKAQRTTMTSFPLIPYPTTGAVF